MFNSKYLFNIFLLGVAVVLLYLGYHFLTTPGEDPGELLDTGESTGLLADGFSTGDVGQSISDEFLSTLTGLQELNLRGEIFANPVFRDLQDSNITLNEQDPGRNNPFAPVNFASGNFSGSAATSTSSASTPTTSNPSRGSSPLDQLRAP